MHLHSMYMVARKVLGNYNCIFSSCADLCGLKLRYYSWKQVDSRSDPSFLASINH